MIILVVKDYVTGAPITNRHQEMSKNGYIIFSN